MTLAYAPFLVASALFGLGEVMMGALVFVACVAVSMAITRWWLDRKQAKHAETIQFFQPTRASGGRQREKTSPMVALTETQTATATSKRSMAEVLVATTRSRQRECPKCQRTFPESVVVCPHDATKLSIRGDARHRVKVLDGVRKPTCHSCGRRFEFGAKYCRFDGQRLSGESVERLAVVWVCRTCGDESLEEGHECAAGCDVIKIDPSDARVIPPMIPMMICDACHRVASPEVTHCPDDNEVLRPMHNVRGDALAPLGVGPRRRVCKQCGRRYSGAARYCAHDGEKLVPLN